MPSIKPSKPILITLILLAIGFGSILGWNVLRSYMMSRFFATYEPAPMTISAVAAEEKTWRPYLKAVGSFIATHGVEISSEAAGIVKTINFQSGEPVKQGTLLIQLDDSVDQAVLQDNLADLTLAKINYQRQKNLFKKGATPSSVLDEAKAKLQKAEAAVAKIQAIIAQKNIRAPFPGKIGIRLVNLGQYVNPGVTKLVTLQALDPLFIQFSLPEHLLKKLYVTQPIELSVEAFGKKVFNGRISAIDAKSDIQTHNVLVQATIPNKAQQLYPGMFADIKILLPQQHKVVTVPYTAIDYTLYGNSVFLIKKDGKDANDKPVLRVYRQYITTGEQQGNEVVILKGLKAGDQVVDSGQLKLHDGTRVIIDNSIKLDQPTEVLPTEEV